jgi:hypothetical protein
MGAMTAARQVVVHAVLHVVLRKQHGVGRHRCNVDGRRARADDVAEAVDGPRTAEGRGPGEVAVTVRADRGLQGLRRAGVLQADRDDLALGCRGIDQHGLREADHAVG